MRKFAAFITCVLISVGTSGMFVQVIPNPGHEVTGCSYPRDPDLGCAHPPGPRTRPCAVQGRMPGHVGLCLRCLSIVRSGHQCSGPAV